ncbi:MAG TPA: hypothetical protein VMW27_13555 [Thermoanaerobaculia bacterium]|nr:hypothetical protein [Thermoanaerobaculia bacterium]
MSNNHRWIVFVGALLLAAMVGFAAWQAGVAHGIEQSGKIVVPPSGGPYPYPYPYYGWHRPWGSGFLFVPFFIVFWVLAVRGLFWRRAWYGGGGPRVHFDEWHRQAHARDAREAAPGVPGER